MSETKQPVEIKISDVQAMLTSGQDRAAIGKHYGLNKAQTKRLFDRPGLKGKKVHKTTEQRDPFTVVDDVTSGSPAVAAEATDEAAY